MNRVEASLRRLLLRLLGRSRADVRTLRDLRHAREILRFAGLFAATILVPALILSYLALSSISSAALQLDVDLRARADTMAEQVRQELATIFERFQEAAHARLEKGESPIDNLGGLSPYLRGGYRFAADGELAAPFELVDIERLPPPSPAWQEAMTRGLRHERSGEAAEAVDAFTHAAAASRHPSYVGEARFARARALAEAGLERDAERALADLYGGSASVRDSHGFRLVDLAVLKRAEIRFARDPDIGATDLKELVEQLLATDWTVGLGGEAAIAARALAILDHHGDTDPDWLAGMRTRHGDLTDQLFWAGRVKKELELVNIRTAEGAFEAYAGLDSVWVSHRHRDLYAFSFSRAAILDALIAAAARISDLDGDLEARVQSGPIPRGTWTSRSLAPLPEVSVIVGPRDPESLTARKQSQARARIFVVIVALFMALVGVVFSANMIGREIEGARMKADFAANVSHELRSPITQIRLKGEALQLGLTDPGEDTIQHYDAIVREAERLSRLVDNVLDFAAIERGAKRYQLRREDIASVVWATAQANRAAVEERGLELTLDVPDDLPPVWLDREAVAQVIVNLISNATKYGGDGGWVGVRVRVGLDGVDVSVSDRGMGIVQQDLEHIFEHFYRSTDPNVRRRKGTGIGLTIVRYIVEAHGGSIAVDSAPGRGTTFTVTFPLERPEELGEHA